MKKSSSLLVLLAFTFMPAHEFSMDLVQNMKPKNNGPAGMSGRVTVFDIQLSIPDVMYAGTASEKILSELPKKKWNLFSKKTNNFFNDIWKAYR